MKRLAPVILFCMLAPGPAFAQDAAENPYVRLSAGLDHSSLAPGDTTDLVLAFAPADDIYLNSDPAVEVTIDSILRPAGTLAQEADGRTGYLRTADPLRQRVILTPAVAPGTHPVTATVTYYYCSASEGWCMKKTQSVQLVVKAEARPPAGNR